MALLVCPLIREDWTPGAAFAPLAARYYVADAESERPASAAMADLCFTKDTKKLWKWHDAQWNDSAGSGGGPHAHPIGEVTGLQTALDGKAASDHTHPGGADPFTAKCVSLSSATTGANVTPVSVPKCSFAFEANAVYLLFLSAVTTAAATTTGSGFQIDTSVAVSVNSLSFVHQLANAGTLTGGSAIADDASVGVSSGRPSANVATPTLGMGTLVTGAQTGTAQLRYRSEVAAVSSVLPGCVLAVVRIA